MFKVNAANGAIHFEDGFILVPPYDSPRYQEYAEWVGQGNSPEEFFEAVHIPVPASVSRFQARAALYQFGFLEQVETIMNSPDTPVLAKLAWQDALEFKRNSPTVAAMAGSLNLSEDQLDNLFRVAGQIEA